MRGEARQVLVRRVRARLALQLRSRGLEPEAVAQAQGVLDPNVLTLGLARRFTEYKRPNLLLRDPERLGRILLNEQRPVQIVIAGKALESDSIEDTVNYGIAFTVIEEIVVGKRRYLIEALALDIAKGLCERFHQITRAKITVRKPSAPVPGVLDFVQVSVEHFAQ